VEQKTNPIKPNLKSAKIRAIRGFKQAQHGTVLEHFGVVLDNFGVILDKVGIRNVTQNIIINPKTNKYSIPVKKTP
jgi:hypothetical protein